MKLVVTWNHHLVSVANEMESPLAQSARRRMQRRGMLLRLANAIFANMRQHKPPYTVTLTRLSPKQLDEHDNLRHAFKNIVDGVCDALGIKNDGDKSKIVFEYRQEQSRKKAIRVEVECGEFRSFERPAHIRGKQL